MTTATISAKGRITIPVVVRNDLQVDAGDRVEFVPIAPGRYEFVAVTREGRPLAGAVVGANKGADSKVTYHTGRAMLNLADTLRRRASPAAETHAN